MSEEPGLNDWPRAHGGPVAQGVLRTEAEDFIVEEQLGFAPDGVGDHVWLYIEKRHANTHWVARKLAELAWVAPSEVGFAGLKDRHALTRQWFSVALCGNKEPDWTALNSTEMRVWEVVRHRHKLRRGDHQANRFQIRLRDFRGDAGKCEEVLRRITEQGFPNYFGEQRFGNDNGNLKAAREWFTGELMPQRSERGFYLSSG